MDNPAGVEMSVINSTLFRLIEPKVDTGMGPIITNDQAVSPCHFNVSRHLGGFGIHTWTYGMGTC